MTRSAHLQRPLLFELRVVTTIQASHPGGHCYGLGFGGFGERFFGDGFFSRFFGSGSATPSASSAPSTTFIRAIELCTPSAASWISSRPSAACGGAGGGGLET